LKTWNSLFSKQAADTLENAVLLGIIGVILAGDFEDSGERIGECINTVTDALCDLWTTNMLVNVHTVALAEIASRNDRENQPTCWLMRSTAMSFLSWVKL
jgi:hypothetical protein